VLAFLVASARGHDIPNARVDRSTQATLRPGRLQIAYEVSLSELTLTQDLKSLIGTIEGGDRQDWFQRYGKETGPLNAKGFLITVDGTPVELSTRSFDVLVEEHPRFTFHFEAGLPAEGRLTIHDTNFAGSEGTSRIAVRGMGGILIRGDDLPGDVEQIPIRPAWQLSDEEERRTKRVEVAFASPRTSPPPRAETEPALARPSSAAARQRTDRLSRLLDRSTGYSVIWLSLIAFAFGAAHAIQPGHGKTLVAATVVGEGGSWLRGALLAVVTTATHTGSVLLVAAGLSLSASTRFEAVHIGLARAAGFVIAAIGFWRLGRHLAGLQEHDEPGQIPDGRAAVRSVVGLGIAGGLVPCWDAVGLILLADAVGRLGMGLVLLVAFGMGMAVVLVAVGWAAGRFRTLAARGDVGQRWERPLGIAASLALAAIGLYLLGTA
jgi:ABC-type nickel/cobalt efflux system permease component RcnA